MQIWYKLGNTDKQEPKLMINYSASEEKKWN